MFISASFVKEAFGESQWEESPPRAHSGRGLETRVAASELKIEDVIMDVPASVLEDLGIYRELPMPCKEPGDTKKGYSTM